MGLSQAMSTAISGLVSHQLAMDTIGNNLANVNTTAYKRADYTFSTLLSATLKAGTESDANTGRGSINATQVGLGAQTGSITTNYEQGGFDTTYNSLDFCLDGVGFFVLKEGNGFCYTRDGGFYLGDDYSLLASDGLHVQGVMADATGTIKDTGQTENLFIKIGSVDSAHETSKASLTGNLDSSEGVASSTKLISSLPADNDVEDYLGTKITTTGTSSWNTLSTYNSDNGGITTINLTGLAALPTANTAYADVTLAAGTYTVNIYNDAAHANLIATGTGTAGFITITEVAASGVNGSLYIASGTATDNDVTIGLNDRYVNGGAVQTSAAYATFNTVSGLYEAANIHTDMRDLYYLSGNTWVKAFSNIANGDTISVEFEKGGVEYSSTFTYTTVGSDGVTPVSSNTLSDFMSFLTGGVDRAADVSTIAEVQALSNTDLVGGVMGTTCISGRVSTGINGGEATYSTPIETAGAFTRTLVDCVDYGSGVLQDSFNVSIVSNIGDSNAISNVKINFNNVAYDDMFASDADLGAVSGKSSTTTSITVYDSLGNERNVQMTMSLVEQDTNFSTYRWEATSTSDTDDCWLYDPSTGQLLTNSVIGTGTFTFDSQGQYVKGSQYSETNGMSLTLENLGVNTPLVVNQTNYSTDTQNLDFSSMSFTALDTSVTLASQNGNAPGTLESFSVTADGVIQGSYSNGVVKDIARLSVALIPNEMGLIAAGDNLYYTSPSSGDAQIEFAGVGGRASVYNEKLEISNVDMSTEFTDLISIQRGFQSNTRVITASDEMLQELLNMKG